MATESASHISFPTIFFFTGLLLLRVAYILITPLDLSPDEAYYWDWSRRLDWGYYSKPPMVAWINWFSTSLLGAKTWTVRLPAAVLSTGSLFFVFLAGRKIFGERAGLLAAFALALTPGASITSLVMTIDAPLIFFWTMSLYFLWKAATSSGPLWWFATALSCGLGLLSKQTMAAFVPFSFLFLLLAKGARHHLKTAWPYLAAVIVMMMVSPFLLWNMKHDWITFVHTSHHFEEVGRENLINFRSFASFAGSQLLVFTPITFLLLILAPFAYYRSERTDAYLFLICTGIMPLACVAILSFKQSVNANWPAPFYVSAALLLGAAASPTTEAAKLNRVGKIIRGWFKPAMILGLSMTLMSLCLPYIVPATAVGGSKLDPTRRLRGWNKFGSEIDKIIAQLPQRQKIILVAKRRQTVSEMAFYCQGHPVAYQWPDENGRIRSQYHLWNGPQGKKGWNALFVIQKNRKFPSNTRQHFKKILPIGSIDIPLGRGGSRAFNLYLGHELQNWP